MRYLLFALVPIMILHAKELNPNEVFSTYQYHHSTLSQLQQKRVLAKMATLKPEKAQHIATQSCKSNIRQSKLIRHGKRLFYAIKTENCSIKIDALDGSIISKKEY